MNRLSEFYHLACCNAEQWQDYLEFREGELSEPELIAWARSQARRDVLVELQRTLWDRITEPLAPRWASEVPPVIVLPLARFEDRLAYEYLDKKGEEA